MTLRTKTLTAVAALTISAAGFAAAQTAAPAPVETEQATPAQPMAPVAETPAPEAPAATTEAPAADAPAEEPAVEAPATDAPSTAAPAAEAPAAEAPTTEAPAATAPEAAPAAEEPAAEPAPAADAPAAEAPAPETAEEAPAAEPAAEAPAAEDAPADEAPAAEAEAPAEEPAAAADAPAQEPVAGAVDDSAETPAESEAAAINTDEHAEGEAAAASHGAPHIEDISFSFEGPFGKYDQFQLQRGLQVYTEVCAACHGMKFVPIRTLADHGGPELPENQVRAYAANLTPIIDAETGEERPRVPTDHFPTVSGMGMGPDLSLMAKARAAFHGPQGTGINQLVRGIGGPEYIHAILTSYTGEESEQAGTLFYGNSAFSTGNISMPPPLSDDQVTYEDGTAATVDQMARDVSAFLMWTAEPKMMDRKSVGFSAVLLLLVLTVLLYFTNKRLWAPFKGKNLHK